MLNISEKRQIISRLSSLLNTYNEFSLLCEEYGNNPDEVRKLVSKIIKYGFVTKNFLYSEYSLVRITHDLDKVDEKYTEYLEQKSKGLFSFFGKNKKKKTSKKKLEKDEEKRKKLNLELDSDIDLEDIEDLELPRWGWINSICEENESAKKSWQEKKTKRDLFYKNQRGFDEVAFTYIRDEFVRVNSSFIYQSDGLTGDIYDDYRILYGGERYVGDFSKISPLNNSFEENLQIIRKSNDISMRKRGNVYEIENGRHRIIYLIRSANDVMVPVSLTKRIEDREFNQRLLELKQKYGISIYKDNILDDEPNILIEYNGFLYPISGTDGVIKFDTAIKDNSLDSFRKVPFEGERDDYKIKRDYKTKYKLLTLKRILDEGTSILEGNFSDFINYYKDDFDNINIPLFLEVYELMQSDLNRAKIYGYDFIQKQREEFMDRFDKNIDDIDGIDEKI